MILGGDVGGFHLETKNVRRATSDTPQKISKVTSLDSRESDRGVKASDKKEGQNKSVMGVGCQKNNFV